MNDAGVRNSLGFGPLVLAISAATLPLASARRNRSACGAGIVALIGSDRPMASIMQAMVEAVPITMQVPTDGARRPFTASISASSISPARYLPHSRRQSVQAPNTSPLWWPTTIGPTGMTTVGRSALIAAITCAGKVLSQPPITITESIGWARIISSVSIAIRFAQIHRGWMRKALGNRDRGEHERHRARQHHPPLGRLDDLGDVSVTGIVVAIGVGDADNRALERVVGITHGLDERLAQEQREAGITIARQPFAQPTRHHATPITGSLSYSLPLDCQ
ncbi:hypothetical protein ACVWW5_005902 [Bradyrhizobium sp. LM3.4]